MPLSDSNSGTNRAMPDVGFDANPNTGVAVIDSFDYGSGTGWIQVGGTSLGSPSWAALIAIADQGRAIEGSARSIAPSQTLPDLYAMPSTAFHENITGGGTHTNPSNPGGYSLDTGRGTPIASSIVGYLDAFNVTATTPIVGSTDDATAPTIPPVFSVTFSDPYSTAGLVGLRFRSQWRRCDFVHRNKFDVDHVHVFARRPILTNQLSQTMTIAAGAIDRAADGSPIEAYSGTFDDDMLPQLTVVSTSPAEGSIGRGADDIANVVFNEAYAPSSISKSNLTLSEGSGQRLLAGQFHDGNLFAERADQLRNIDRHHRGRCRDRHQRRRRRGLHRDLCAHHRTVQGTPVGSLVYESESGGTISTGGSSQSYTLDIAAGQVFSAVVTPGSLTEAKLVVTGPGISGSDTAQTTSRTAQVVLQTITSTGGTYTFTVSSVRLAGPARSRWKCF